MPQTATTGYAPVNGLSLYYEAQGSGEPLVLLHGGLGATWMFAPLVPAFAARRRVIAVDLQAHGRTTDSDRPMTFEAMADDIAALLARLDIPHADVLGYSLGAGVAIRMAIQHKTRVRRLVAISYPFRRDGWFPEVRAGMDQIGPSSAEAMRQSPIHRRYEEIAPRPQDWPRLVTKLGDLVRREFDWSDEIGALAVPALLMFGDADSVRPAHIVEMFARLGGGQRDAGWDGKARPPSRLAILPGATHYDILSTPGLAVLVQSFLDADL